MRYKAIASAFDAAHERIGEGRAICQDPEDASKRALAELLASKMPGYWVTVETVITIED